jgi:hypothetical protein
MYPPQLSAFIVPSAFASDSVSNGPRSVLFSPSGHPGAAGHGSAVVVVVVVVGSAVVVVLHSGGQILFVGPDTIS